MVLVKVAGEIDLATRDELRNMRNDILGKSDPKPLYKDYAASVQGNGTVPTIILGGPPTGRVWRVLSVTVVGNNDHGTIGSPLGFVAMYFGDPANPNLAQVKKVKMTLPSTDEPGLAYVCQAPQQIFFLGDNTLNAPDNCTITMTVEEWRASDLMDNSGAP
jgi:hypothetical protein